MIRISIKGKIQPQVKITINGFDYYPSYNIHPTKNKHSRYSNKIQGRLFNRLEECTQQIVYKGITYYNVDIEDRGW
jgi:hypothetical protein